MLTKIEFWMQLISLNWKLSGRDIVSITISNVVKELIAKPLKTTVNDSVTNGNFPDIWKLERVTPIIETCAKVDAENYRPISAISIFSRMLERLLHD